MIGISSILTAGSLTGIAILALKSGIGCGLSGLKYREILGFAGVYAIAAFIMGIIAGSISPDLSDQILAIGLLMHIIIAFGLVYFGIKTKKNWIANRRDISRKTFLWLSLPCPACLTATFLACLVLTDVTEIGGAGVGVVTGIIFFAGITGSALCISWTASRLNRKNPSTLGNIMIVLGLFYLLCPLIIPAYIESKNVPEISVIINSGDIITGMIILCIPVLSGYIMRKMTHQRE
ncbi:MAG: DUF2162 domain-containing protein [Methanogenium sp.]|nr:DUF2162 domain-containing protein [Methanogenium sp.]